MTTPTTTNISVQLLIAGQTERKTVDLPVGATVAQLKAKFNELNSGIFKDLTSGTVTALTDTSPLTNGAILSFAPTESRTTNSGVQVVTKKIVGNNDAVNEVQAPDATPTDGIEMVNVKVVVISDCYTGTVPSIFTVADVLEQAGISCPCVFVNGVEIGYGQRVTADMQIELRQCQTESLFPKEEVDCDDCDCDCDCDSDEDEDMNRNR